jgi:hypothetical protein
MQLMRGSLVLLLTLAASFAVRAQQLSDRVELGVYSDDDHVSVVTPSVELGLRDQTAGYDVAARYSADVVSAASVDIVATASRRFHELRHVVSARGSVERDALRAAANASVSSEPDALSLSGGVHGELALRDDQLRLLLGYAIGHDSAGRTGTPLSVFAHELTRHVASAGASLVLSESSLAWLGLELGVEHGDASKPYRYVSVFSAQAAPMLPRGASPEQVDAVRLAARVDEALPRSRVRAALIARYSRRSHGLSLRGEQRLYIDSWGMLASTTDVRAALDLSRDIELGASVRFHAQGGVNFWQRAIVAEVDGSRLTLPKYRTGDRELGPLITLTFGADVRWALAPEYAAVAQAFSFRVALQRTRFADALYLSERLGLIAVFSAEGSFD